jgi:hypothetical protein
MKTLPPLLAAFALSLTALPVLAETALTDEKIAQIEAKLAEMECQMDTDDIEVEDDGYDLDDVICKGGGQFDIKLDLDLNEVARSAE